MEFLKELMGSAYRDDLTKEEIQAFFKKQVLSSGDYVLAGKVKGEKQELNDKIAELQSQLEAKMTDDDKKKKADEDTKKLIEKLTKELADSKSSQSKMTAKSALATVKEKAGIKDDDTEYDEFISSIAFEDNEKTDKISKYISKIISSAYETGKSEAIKNKLGKMGSFKEGQDGEGSEEKGAFGKELAQATKVDTTVQKDFFERK
jgi:effector-binding domain-containing protein